MEIDEKRLSIDSDNNSSTDTRFGMNALSSIDIFFRTAIQDLPSRFSRIGLLLIGVIFGVFATAPAEARVHRLNADELKLHRLISSSSLQKRGTTDLDPILCKVARDRAADMDRRGYFAHTNPDGLAANFLVRRAGFVLPAHYDQAKEGNWIESIGKTTGTPSGVFALWLNSELHRDHVLAESDFRTDQTSIGVGVFKSKQAPYYRYYVFISAPKNLSPSPPLWILKDPKGKVIARTRGNVALLGGGK